jgi:hypothetical protein
MEVIYKGIIEPSELTRAVNAIKSVIEEIKRLFGENVYVHEEWEGSWRGNITVFICDANYATVSIDFLRKPESTELIKLKAYIDIMNLPEDRELRKNIFSKLIEIMCVIQTYCDPIYDVVLNSHSDTDTLNKLLEMLGFR